MTYLLIAAIIIAAGFQQVWDGRGDENVTGFWAKHYGKRNYVLGLICLAASWVGVGLVWFVPFAIVTGFNVVSSPNGLFGKKWKDGSQNAMVMVRFAVYPAIALMLASASPWTPELYHNGLVWLTACIFTGVAYNITRNLDFPPTIQTTGMEFLRGALPVGFLCFI
ncbi:hypothetical protein N9937_02245 [bacterium]|nr:hypothetical protein [bacterium]